MDSGTENRNENSNCQSRNVSKRVRKSLGTAEFSDSITNLDDYADILLDTHEGELPKLVGEVDTEKIFRVKYVHNKSLELKKFENFMLWLREVYSLFQIQGIVKVLTGKSNSRTDNLRAI